MFKRETIKFIIPRDMSSLIMPTFGNKRTVPLYINPTTIQTTYSKNISETQTIGGFVIQYWGDKITTLSIQGTTGSGGIEAINILYDIYKSEQTSFKDILLKRQSALLEQINKNEELLESEATGLQKAQAIDQVLFGGAITDLVSGASETMDYFRKSITGESIDRKQSQINLLPTLSAFAVSLEMHYQGRINRGFIDNMNVTESANAPGHFDYSINFKSLKEYGERKNFMPWHINPYNEAGEPIQKPKVGPNGLNYNLSFPIVSPGRAENTAKTVSRVIDDQVGTSKETGSIDNISRLSKIRR